MFHENKDGSDFICEPDEEKVAFVTDSHSIFLSLYSHVSICSSCKPFSCQRYDVQSTRQLIEVVGMSCWLSRDERYIHGI